MRSPIWNCTTEATLVDGLATVWWLDLTSPFGNSPAGLDLEFTLPDGLEVLNSSHRPVFGVGPDAHRPLIYQDGSTLTFSFPRLLPGENDRRPITHPHTWCNLFFPIVVRATREADGRALPITCRAMGDSDSCEITVSVLSNPGIVPPCPHKRSLELSFFPWFSQHEQEALCEVLRRCSITDVSLNWHDHGIPLLPMDAYTVTAKLLRRMMPDVKIWIDGMPGADTIAPRAEDIYGRPLSQLASPEALTQSCPDLLISTMRSWCHAVDADGVLVTMSEPGGGDADYVPAHCFSAASRAHFAQEQGLDTTPDSLHILRDYREAWTDFCWRQMHHVLDLTRMAIGNRPLAICALGPQGLNDNGPNWQRFADIADILIYTHHHQAPEDKAEHWGQTRLSTMPHTWWERWQDPLDHMDDPSMATADMKIQLAISGNTAIRICSWASLDGRLQHQLMNWR